MARTEGHWLERGTYLEPDDPLGYDILIKGLNKYLNFNYYGGSSGYGFRDNNGVIEFKDDGETWKSITGAYGLTFQQVTDNGATTDNIITVPGIQFDTTATPSTNAEGLLQWNATDGTLDLGMDEGNITMQIGQEMFMKVRNVSGSTIPNGTPVYVSGRTGNRPNIYPAKGDAEATSRVVGVTTQDIDSPADGFVTTVGYVRQIKTNYSGTGDWGTTWVEGDLLYVSKDVAGQLTNVEPDAPHHSDVVGTVEIVGALGIGSILIAPDRHKTLTELSDVNGTALTTLGQIPVWHQTEGVFDFDYNINDYLTESDFAEINRQGVVSRAETTIAFDGTNTFTLTSVGASWSYYRAGIKYTITGNKSVVIPGTPIASGTWYIYIDATDGTLTASQTVWTLLDTKVPIATINFNDSLTPKYWTSDERHSIAMDGYMQYYLHNVDGARSLNTPTLTGYTVNTDTNVAKTFAISAGTLVDQDIVHTLSSLTDPDGTSTDYVVWYRTGASTWTWKLSNMPFLYNTSTDWIQYDNAGTPTDLTGGAGALTRWTNSYLLLTNKSGASRFVITPGRGVFTSLADAKAESVSAFVWDGFPIAESVIVYQLTWSTITSTSQGKCRLASEPTLVNISTITNNSSGAGTDHNTLSNLQGGTLGEYYHLTSAEKTSVEGLATTYVPYTGATGDVDLGSNLISAGNFNQKTYSVAVPSGTDAVEFAQVTTTNFSANVEIWFTVHNNSYAQSKRYFAPLSYNGTQNNWHKMLPVSTTGAYVLNDAEIDVKILNNIATFRVRRIGGSTAGTAEITLAVGSDIANTTISDASATYSSATVTSNYASTSLTQRAGKTGINNDAPTGLLDIKGTTDLFRLSYNTSNYLKADISSVGVTTFTSVGTTPSVNFRGGSFNVNNIANGTDTVLTTLQGAPSTSSGTARKEVLRLQTSNVYGVAYGQVASFQLSRWEDAEAVLRGRSSLVLKLQNGTSLDTELFAFQSNGYMGVGTITPNAPLEVKTGAVADTIPSIITSKLVTTGNSFGASFRNATPTTGNAMIEIAGISSGTPKPVQLRTDSDGDFSIHFGGANYGTLGTERFTILNSGYVGINKSAPVASLDVQGVGADTVPAILAAKAATGGNALGISFRNTTETTGGAMFEIAGKLLGTPKTIQFVGNSAGDVGIFTGSTSYGTIGTEKFTVLNGGNVGIGVSSPTYKLEVSGSASIYDGVNTILFANGTDAIDVVAGDINMSGSGQIKWTTSYINDSYLDGSWYVGTALAVNTAPSAYTFEVAGASTFTNSGMYTNIADGVFGIDTSGPAKFQANVQMSGLSSGAGAPATILTNFNLYVDTTTGIVYVD